MNKGNKKERICDIVEYECLEVNGSASIDPKVLKKSSNASTEQSTRNLGTTLGTMALAAAAVPTPVSAPLAVIGALLVGAASISYPKYRSSEEKARYPSMDLVFVKQRRNQLFAFWNLVVLIVLIFVSGVVFAHLGIEPDYYFAFWILHFGLLTNTVVSLVRIHQGLKSPKEKSL